MNRQGKTNYTKLSKLEEKLNRCLVKFGTDAVMIHLDKMDNYTSERDVLIFDRIVKISSKVYGVTQQTVVSVDKGEDPTDCRRIISYIASKETELSKPTIADMLNITARSVNNYLADVEHRLTSKGWAGFNKRLEEIYSAVKEVIEDLIEEEDVRDNG